MYWIGKKGVCFLVNKSGYNLWRISHKFKKKKKKCSRPIGLYESKESGGLIGFTNITITIWENFHIERKYDNLNIALNI